MVVDKKVILCNHGGYTTPTMAAAEVAVAVVARNAGAALSHGGAHSTSQTVSVLRILAARQAAVVFTTYQQRCGASQTVVRKTARSAVDRVAHPGVSVLRDCKQLNRELCLKRRRFHLAIRIRLLGA